MDFGNYGPLAFFGGMMFFTVFFLIASAIAYYVLSSFGLYTLAKNRGIENPWLAWIPVGNAYILAKLIGSLSIGTWQIPNLEVVLPVAFGLMGFASRLPLIGGLIWIAGLILTIMAYYKLFKIYRPGSAVLYTVLTAITSVTVIFVFVAGLLVFMIRNDAPSEISGI